MTTERPTTQPPLVDIPTATRRAANTGQPHKLPDHVKRRLEQLGLLDPVTGATRRARACLCPTCRRPVMRGIDREYGGMSVDADPEPLTVNGEVNALMTGARTYNLQWVPRPGGMGYTLDSRDQWQIARWPAGSNGMDVLAEHSHQPRHYETAASQLPDTAATVIPADDDPPY